jgi:ABC-type protease/lipase transport system fused ATPase/permease subunit
LSLFIYGKFSVSVATYILKRGAESGQLVVFCSEFIISLICVCLFVCLFVCGTWWLGLEGESAIAVMATRKSTQRALARTSKMSTSETLEALSMLKQYPNAWRSSITATSY